MGRHDYEGPERRRAFSISEEDAQRIAKAAAKEALAEAYEDTIDKVYAEIGRNVVSKALVAVGAIVFGMIVWAKAKGWL